MTLHSEPGHLPYPEGTDAADGPAQFEALTDRLAAIFDSYTTAARDALAGTDLWLGRVIFNETTGTLQVLTDDSPATWAEAGISDHGALGGLGDDDHTQYTKKATLTAKGDLYVATASGVITRRAVGADGRALVADSGQADGVNWADLSATYLAKALADAAGDLLVADGADSWVRLAKGSALQVLRVNAGATGLEYATPAAGALTKIATATGTGSSGVLSFSSIPATYGALLLVWILEATGAGTLCRLRFNGDTGNNYTFGNNVTQSGIALNTPPSTTDILYGFCLIPGYAQTSEEKGVLGIHQYWGGSSGTAAQQETQKAGWASTAAINAIEVAITANSFSTLAKVQLYGLEA